VPGRSNLLEQVTHPWSERLRKDVEYALYSEVQSVQDYRSSSREIWSKGLRRSAKSS
jgi:hypothetical protein